MLANEFPFHNLIEDQEDSSFRTKNILDSNGHLVGCCWIDIELNMAVIFHECEEDDLDDRVIGYAKFLDFFGIDFQYHEEDMNDLRYRADGDLTDTGFNLYEEHIKSKNKKIQEQEKS